MQKKHKLFLKTSPKYITLAIAAAIISPMTQADVDGKKIGDLEIYKQAEGGKVTITMMFDTSGSMSVIDYTSLNPAACDFPNGVRYSSHSFNQEDSNTTPNYKRSYCIGSDNKKYYDRITRLKDAVFALMDSKDLTENQVSIGVGQYSSSTLTVNGRAYGDSTSGRILVPAAPLSDAQRLKIKTEAARLSAGGTTPSAAAYAETGAYMLGTTTQLTAAEARPIGSVPPGFRNSSAETKNSSGTAYKSPLPDTPASCDGQGIYFLTDGVPNYANQPEIIMGKALNLGKALPFGTPGVDTLPQGSSRNQHGVADSGTPQVGMFAKVLRDASQNPKGVSIRTAVVGFGSIFDTNQYTNIVQELTKPKLDINTSLPIEVPASGDKGKFFDCSKITGSVDARNACNWGAKSHPSLPGVGGYGEGGFYSAQSTQDVIDSVKTFLGDLRNTIDPAPAGTIVVPDDPYSLSSKQAIAYYPTVEAKVSEQSAIWPGNMKKYSLKEGTLFGKANIQLFKNQAGDLNPDAEDLWSDKNYGGNNQTTAGGFYAQLKTPKGSVGTVRKLYIQDAGQLKTFGVSTSGKVTVNDTQITDSSLTDPIYQGTTGEDVKKRLLNFLGFTTLPTGLVKNMTLTAPSEDVKVLGASIHSAPAVVSHGADLDDNGRVKPERPNDYVLFGSMDGALHLVKAGNYGVNGGGQEEFAFIPQEMLKGQNIEGLNLTGKGTGIGVPNFGIDAPWLVAADYKFDLGTKKVTIDKKSNSNPTGGIGMYAYGGLRMGGKAFYGLNLENINAPRLAFALDPSQNNFKRMGQIWSKPVRAKIRMGTSDATGTEVLIFGGGYDMCYENQNFQVGVTDTTLGTCSGKTEAEGNALYIINAQTGALIWSASSSTGATTTNADMKHSIVGEVTTLDRDNDGLMDVIYFADLGGQVFRADFRNGGASNSFGNVRIVKLLASTYTSNEEKKYNHRFYENPVVSVYRNSSTNRLFALVNVISGDRSSPLSKMRTDNKYADRVYGLIDNDVSLPAKTFYGTSFVNSFGTTGITEAQLVNIPALLATKGSSPYSKDKKDEVINMVKNQMNGSTKVHGWYYPLTRFNGYANVRYTKGVGRSTVIGSTLYTTTYNPDMDYNSNSSSCTAKIVGGSERQLYCLPYGICVDDTSKTGTGGFVPAGRGIQELTLGPRGDTPETRNQTVLIGNQTFTQQANSSVDYGRDGDKNTYIETVQKREGNTSVTQEGGDGSAGIFLYNERFQLQPKTWYEVN